MEISLLDRFKSAWDAFRGVSYTNVGGGYSSRPDRPRLSRGNERSIITSFFNRVAVDVSEVDIMHVRLDENERFMEKIDSGLERCLTEYANIDQTAKAFIIDVVLSLLDEGHVAVVPVYTDIDPIRNESFKVSALRTGKIIEWYPEHVRVNIYNDRIGRKEDILLPKRIVAIIENPFYSIMNEPNSTMQRLIRKLNLLDAIDEQSGSGKLDLLIQLPYVIKSEARKKQAEERRASIEEQLTGSRYGIAYTDGTEKIIQLNRPAENHLMSQIEFLTSMLYSQLGFTKEILDGTADDKTMLNYYNRIIEPILSAIVDEMRRKFLTRTAISQRQSIIYFRNPFGLVPVNNIAEIADKFTRNEILTSNEVRQIIGMKPSDDPEADILRNKNLNKQKGEVKDPVYAGPKGDIQNEETEV